MLFLFFRVVCHNFFVISLDIENAKPNLALAITTSNDAREMLPIVSDKTIKDLSKQSKAAIYLLSLLFINYLFLIFVIK